jgi:prepilin-type N-terminal cleavage/methylation domain-containing protein
MDKFLMMIRDKKAFTLIETVVALVIAGIILSVIYYGFSLSIRITKSGNDVLYVTDIAKKVYSNFIKKKNEIPLDNGYSESGEIENISYKIKVKNIDFNINNNFNLNLEKYYQVFINILKDKKTYNFEFYIEK